MEEAYPHVPDNMKGVKALTFDVFGTTVDWRSTVTQTLITALLNKTSSSSRAAQIDPNVRRKLHAMGEQDWSDFAQEWRDSYKAFVKGFNAERDEWIDIDTHHRRSLVSLLRRWELEGLYTEAEIDELSKVWHFLDPWTDTVEGLQKVGEMGLVTSTLSNGNQELLRDLNEHQKLGFQRLQSSADFGMYKPDPRVYSGACEKMGYEPRQVAMVAAHLSDLKAARGVGLRTIYVERPREEDWKSDSREYQDAKQWVDVWVTEKEDGFLEVARRLAMMNK